MLSVILYTLLALGALARAVLVIVYVVTSKGVRRDPLNPLKTQKDTAVVVIRLTDSRALCGLLEPSPFYFIPSWFVFRWTVDL